METEWIEQETELSFNPSVTLTSQTTQLTIIGCCFGKREMSVFRAKLQCHIQYHSNERQLTCHFTEQFLDSSIWKLTTVKTKESIYAYRVPLYIQDVGTSMTNHSSSLTGERTKGKRVIPHSYQSVT